MHQITKTGSVLGKGWQAAPHCPSSCPSAVAHHIAARGSTCRAQLRSHCPPEPLDRMSIALL
eukprot:349961-Chlamydomonas_euryale.AAC.13